MYTSQYCDAEEMVVRKKLFWVVAFSAGVNTQYMHDVIKQDESELADTDFKI